MHLSARLRASLLIRIAILMPRKTKVKTILYLYWGQILLVPILNKKAPKKFLDAFKINAIAKQKGGPDRYSLAIKGAINKLTTLITLIRIAIPGPDVSLNGSPTISPTTAAL